MDYSIPTSGIACARIAAAFRSLLHCIYLCKWFYEPTSTLAHGGTGHWLLYHSRHTMQTPSSKCKKGYIVKKLFCLSCLHFH